MLLSFNLLDIIYVPLGLILRVIYLLVNNYGWSILIFALLTKVLLLPLAVKGEKGRLRMNKIQPKMKKLEEKYHNDRKNPKYQEELQELYTREGYSPTAGCLPQLIQLPVIFGLWNAIRRPLTYVCLFSEQLICDTVDLLHGANVGGMIEKLFVKDGALMGTQDLLKAAQVNEIHIAQAINENLDSVRGLRDLIGDKLLIDTKFLGINLGVTASENGGWFLLIPAIAAISSFLSSYLSMKINKTPGTENDPAAKSMGMMLFVMPLLSLFIGYSMNFGVAIYWISSNLLALAQTVLLHYFIKPEEEEAKAPKEKKLNYTQIEKMNRDALPDGESKYAGKKKKKNGK